MGIPLEPTQECLYVLPQDVNLRHLHGRLAQQVERLTVNQYVVGSIPTVAASMAVMPVTAIALIAYSAWAPHYKTCPPCKPRVAAGLSRWPFKPKYRVQLSDGVRVPGYRTIIYAHFKPYGAVGQAIGLSSRSAEFNSPIGYIPFVSGWKPLTRILQFNYHRHSTQASIEICGSVICGKRKTVYKEAK